LEKCKSNTLKIKQECSRSGSSYSSDSESDSYSSESSSDTDEIKDLLKELDMERGTRRKGTTEIERLLKQLDSRRDDRSRGRERDRDRTRSRRSSTRNRKNVRLTFVLKLRYGRSRRRNDSLFDRTTAQQNQLTKYIDSFYAYLKRKDYAYDRVSSADIHSNSTVRLEIDMDTADKNRVKTLFSDFYRSHTPPGYLREYDIQLSSVS
jgi:hypothetical protein